MTLQIENNHSAYFNEFHSILRGNLWKDKVDDHFEPKGNLNTMKKQ